MIDYISQASVEIYGNRNGKACPSMPYLTLKRSRCRSTKSMSRYCASFAFAKLCQSLAYIPRQKHLHVSVIVHCYRNKCLHRMTLFNAITNSVRRLINKPKKICFLKTDITDGGLGEKTKTHKKTDKNWYFNKIGIQMTLS